MEKKFKAKIVNSKIEFLEKIDFTKLENKIVDIVVMSDINKRTIQQNEYYWGCVVPIIASDLGYDIETMHDVLKHKFLKKTKEFINNKGQKEEFEKTISTTKLTTKQFVDYIESIKRWASEFLNIYIPEAGEIYISKDLTIN